MWWPLRPTTPSLWSVCGQEPPSYTFPPWCAEAEAEASGQYKLMLLVDWMLFHSLESSDFPFSLGVKAHYTQSVATSKAFLSGASMQDICNAEGWTTPLTFARFLTSICMPLRAPPFSRLSCALPHT